MVIGLDENRDRRRTHFAIDPRYKYYEPFRTLLTLFQVEVDTTGMSEEEIQKLREEEAKQLEDHNATISSIFSINDDEYKSPVKPPRTFDTVVDCDEDDDMEFASAEVDFNFTEGNNNNDNDKWLNYSYYDSRQGRATRSAVDKTLFVIL